jgi:hypothetical protein
MLYCQRNTASELGLNEHIGGMLEALVWASQTAEKGCALSWSVKKLKAEIDVMLHDVMRRVASDLSDRVVRSE